MLHALAALFLGASLQEAPPPAPPTSLLSAPLYLEEEPPECRSVRSIRLAFAGEPGSPGSPASPASIGAEEALALARNLRGMLRAGADFGDLARLHSRSPQSKNGGILGTFPPGVLLPAFDEFLFAAGIGAVSEPIVFDGAVHLLQRIERWAACRQIYLKGRDEKVRARAVELIARLRHGEDFKKLAREHSDDAPSAQRGGAWRIFERGADDTLLKKAAFEAGIGEVFGPLASPLGYHVGLREPLEVENDPASGFAKLREDNWVRATALLVAHDKGKRVRERRSLIAASDLAQELEALIRDRGSDLAAFAAKHTDEPGARARGGDLGWIYRGNPNRLRALEKLFLVTPGTLLQPKPTDEGWILLQRTQ